MRYDELFRPMSLPRQRDLIVTHDHIVADGRDHALDGAKEQLSQVRLEIVGEVSAKYAPLIKKAGWVRRIYLRMRMSTEIERRLAKEVEKVAPQEGLYFTDNSGNIQAPQGPTSPDQPEG